MPALEFKFDCFGDESNILECPKAALSKTCEANASTVGVVCPEPCFDGVVRLVDGSDNLEGRVEVCVDGFWSSVCDQSWSTNDATVACKQLGFSSIGR